MESRTNNVGFASWYTILQTREKFVQRSISCRDGPEKSMETSQGRKNKKDTLLWKDDREERQEHYPTSVAYTCTCTISIISTMKYVTQQM